MLQPDDAQPAHRDTVRRVQRDSHNRRSPALYDECVALMQQCAAARDDAGFVLVAKAFAVVVDQRGHGEQAFDLLQEALERARERHWFDEQAELLVLIGRAHYGRADYPAALEAFTEAIDVAQRAGALLSWGWAQMGVGQVCDALDSPSLALAVFGELSSVLARELRPGRDGDDGAGDKLRLYNHINLGVNHVRLGQLAQARQAFETALALARALDIGDETGETLFRLAELDHLEGQDERALQRLDEAEPLCLAASFHWALAQCALLRGTVRAGQGDLRAASALAGAAIAQAQQAGARHVELRARRARSAWAERLGDAPAALADLHEVVRLQEGIDRRSRSQTLNELEDLAGVRLSADRRLLTLSIRPEVDAGDWPRTMELLCAEGREALDVERVVWWVFDAEALQPVHASGGERPTQRIDAVLAPELLRRLRSGAPVLAHTARHHQDTWPLAASYLEPHDVQALLVHPVLLGGDAVGAFFFEQIGHRRPWGRSAMVLAHQLVAIAARCLGQRARREDQQRIRSLNEQLREANAELESRVERRTSELRAAMKQLEASRAEAERNARAKGEFLAHMSHEIRTPLNGVLGMAQVGLQLSHGRLPAQRSFQRILESGQLLLGVINDILDFSKLDAGMLRIESVPVALGPLVTHSVALIENKAREKGLRLHASVDPDLPVGLADPLRISQILMNLLSNAVKFTESGRIEVEATRDGDALRLVVRDTGIGIAPDQMDRIFEPFRQVDGTKTRIYGGTGLGLTITRRLAEQMQGTVQVASTPGAGSDFALRLPWRPAPLIDGARSDWAPADMAPLHGARVLVAEDNDVNRIVVEQLLLNAGVNVVMVGNGREAVERVTGGGEPFDAVLMDIQMPEMDGYEATRQLRALSPQLPVIGLTAHALEEDRRLCLESGMVDHVAKPIVTEVLLAALRRHVAPR